MTAHFRSCRFATLLLASLTAAGALSAQQRICFSVHDGPTVGHTVTSFSSTSHIDIGVDGADLSWNPLPSGRTAAQVSAGMEFMFTSRNYGTQRSSPTDFCVISKPSGALIWNGGQQFNDDAGISLDMRIEPLNSNAAPETKGHGVGIGLPRGTGTFIPPFGGFLLATLEIERNGARIDVPVPIPLPPGAGPLLVAQLMEQAFVAAGFLVNRVRWGTSNAPIAGLGIDHTVAGEPVHHVLLQMDPGARCVVPMAIAAGIVPLVGATEFGMLPGGNLANAPFACGCGSFRIGSLVDFQFHMRSFNNMRPAASIINLDYLTPALGFQGSYLLVDPTGAVVQFGLTDNAGVLHRTITIPNDPALDGLPLFAQGAVMGGAIGAAIGLSPAIAARIGR